MEIYTIGFTKHSAEQFFGALKDAGIRRLIDVRLKNDSQLAGFTRRRDLPFFLDRLIQADYVHEQMLAPTEEMLSEYRRRLVPWQQYERRFLDLMRARQIEDHTGRGLFRVPSALLCSEFEPARCHRRLVAEYLAGAWGDIQIRHL
jgi:uncharacterized protein (DUF488 family)